MLQEAWSRLKLDQDAWYWLTEHMQTGDVYQLFSLAKAFRQEHGGHRPIFLVTSSVRHAQVAALFGDEFAGVMLTAELRGSARDWRQFFEQGGLPTFGPNLPVVGSPAHNPDTHGLESTGDRLQLETSTTYMAYYRHILRLQPDVEPAPLPPDSASADRLRDVCRRHGVVQGRSVILSPYGSRWPVEGKAHFTALAAELLHRGVRVFTIVMGGEAVIAGTQALQLPLALLPAVAEYAGEVIAVRSGAADVLAGARCRKTIIYSNPVHLSVWGLDALDLSRDARQFTFDFRREGPGLFVERVLSGATAEPFSRCFAAPVSRLTPAPGATNGLERRELSFAEIQRDPESGMGRLNLACARFAEDGGVLALLDLPRRDQTRWGDVIDHALASLTNLTRDGDVRLYTLRNRLGTDFFEEVDAFGLIGGFYHAARYWHAVVAVKGDINGLLAPADRARVLPLSPLVPDLRVDLGQAFDSLAHRALFYLDHPLDIDGVQFVDGWQDLEPWGLWSRGERSVVKFCLETPPPGGFRLELEVHAAISDQFPVLEFNVEINGVVLASTHTAVDAPLERLTVKVPAEMAARTRVFWAALVFASVRSPEEQGIGPDPRRVALGLRSLHVIT
ncbi:hypothetical protein [Caulobacter sp. S45]|uniref:hypothetical protein n=1 Tax=Caulobacter sp. S45 TaxID=1641861 RepID=UPI00157652F6|nr:hypothetical protein [Caulobacter sp. S45]